jgi:hypothetical protein
MVCGHGTHIHTKLSIEHCTGHKRKIVAMLKSTHPGESAVGRVTKLNCGEKVLPPPHT